MSDSILIKKLSSASSRKEEGVAYMEKLKTAGPADFVLSQLAKRKDLIRNSAIGAGVIGGVNFAQSKKNKVTGHSSSQVYWNKALTNLQKKQDELTASGKKLEYSDRMHMARTKGHKDVADISADHPVKSSVRAGLMYGLPTATLGKYILKLLTKKG